MRYDGWEEDVLVQRDSGLPEALDGLLLGEQLLVSPQASPGEQQLVEALAHGYEAAGVDHALIRLQGQPRCRLEHFAWRWAAAELLPSNVGWRVMAEGPAPLARSLGLPELLLLRLVGAALLSWSPEKELRPATRCA